MQTTLLGVAIAIILALVSALVAPLVVDWNQYRSVFEQEASSLTGMDVRVNGAIDARILPTPLIKLHDIEVGDAGREPALRADTIELELGLGPLLRGEFRATEMHVIEPRINLGLDRSGTVVWPAIASSAHPESLSISRLNIENGRVVLGDAASGSRAVLQKLWFKGDIRSFNGQFKGEGAFISNAEGYGYRISGNRPEVNGGLKIKLGIDPANHPLTTDFDGTLSFDHGSPQFDGTFVLARPVGAALSGGERVVNDPWHAGGKISATPAKATLRDITYQYGPDERAVNFNGQADLTFGVRPQFSGTLSALQADIDRVLADPDLTHRPPLLVVKSFIESFVAPLKLPLPGDLHADVTAMTVGATTLQALRGTARFDGAAWSLNDFAFRAPGSTDVSLSGRLTATPRGLSFTGPGALQSADLDAFLGWLRGRGDQPTGQSRSLNARGVVTLASDRMAVDQLTAAFDRQNVEGRLAYTWATDKTLANLDVEVRAAALDLDALSTFGKAALAGDGLPLPREATLALDVGRATLAGVNGQAIKAQIKVDAGVLQIDKLSVGELGGAALDISGRIDELSSQPRGRLTLNLNAHALTGLADVIGKFAPQSADVLRRFADRLAPANIHGTLTVDRAAAKSSAAKLDLDGQMGALHVNLNGTATGEPSSIGKSVVRVATELDASDSGTLVALFGLDSVVAVAPRAGRLLLAAAGPLDGDFKIDGQLSAGGLDAAVQGTMRLTGDQAPTGAMQVLASASDFRPLNRAMIGQSGVSVPMSGRAALAVNGKALSLTDLAVTVGKSSLRGRIALNLAKPLGVDGDVQADNVDAASVSALLLGQPSKTDAVGGLWSSEPFAAGAFSAASGAVRFKFDRAAFTPALVVSDLKGTAQFRPAEITLSNIDGSVAEGRVTGEVAFRRDKDGLTVHARGELAGARGAALFPALSKNAIDGPLTIKLQSDSVGQSPLGFIGFLRGSGAITLTDAQIAGLDGAAFDAAVRTADQSGTIEAPKILAAVNAAMANGRITVPHGDTAFVINAGRLSLQKSTLQSVGGTTLSLGGTLDLATAALDGRVTLQAKPAVNALIPLPPELSVTFQGPLGAPARAVDVTALVGWLTLRAAELQTRRIESIEANRRPEAAGPLVRLEPPTIRTAPAGTVVESEAPADVPPPGSRGFDRLQADPTAAPAAVSAPPPVRPATPRPTGKSTSSAETTDQIRPPPAPQTAAPTPAARSGFDFLFRPQN